MKRAFFGETAGYENKKPADSKKLLFGYVD